MGGVRWQHLDRRRPGRHLKAKPERGTVVALDAAAGREAGGEAPAAHPALQAAQGYYLLNQFQACVDSVSTALRDEPRLPGAQRLLGLALGKLDDLPAAISALALAVEEAPADLPLRASLLSAELRAGILPESDPGEWEHPPLQELGGAAAWRRGQAHLRAGRSLDALRSFIEARSRFRGASPVEVLPERLAACYFGEAISALAAEQFDTAQLAFGRGYLGVPFRPAVHSFAGQVYAVAEAARELERQERAAALAPLSEFLLQARLQVRFYDQARPVVMHWDRLP